MLDKTLIGRESEATVVEVEKGPSGVSPTRPATPT